MAPGFNVPVVRRDDGGDGGDGMVLQCMKWGLVPGFTKQTDKIDHFKMVMGFYICNGVLQDAFAAFPLFPVRLSLNMKQAC